MMNEDLGLQARWIFLGWNKKSGCVKLLMRFLEQSPANCVWGNHTTAE